MRRCCSAARRRHRRRSRCRACASACRRSSSRRRSRATSTAPCAPRWPSSSGSARRWSTCSLPRTELSIPVYYIIAPAEAIVEPEPLRRRALRPPRRALRRPARHVQEEPQRRLRPRGQAPHHDRHLRALARLLRRLLPAGAEAAPHDRRRLPGLLPRVRRDRRAGRADRRVEARRARATTRSPTTWPTSSRCRPAWPACPA